MATYRAIADGFYDGVFYSPRKRNILVREKPFARGKTPTWLTLASNETPVERKHRIAAEHAAQEKATSDAEAISSASFMGEGGAGVDTL